MNQQANRILVTILLSVAIFGLWQWIFVPKPPPTPPTQNAPVVTQPKPSTPAPAAGPPRAERPAENRVTVRRPGYYEAVFTSWGAAPASFMLLDPQYQEMVWVPKTPGKSVPPRSGDDDPNWERKLVPIDLVRRQVTTLPYTVTLADSNPSLPLDAAWIRMPTASDEELVYAIDVGTLHIEKHWRLPREGYELGLRVTVENRAPGGSQPVPARLLVHMSGWQDPSERPSALSFGRRYNLSYASCDIAGKLHRQSLEELVHGTSSGFGCGGETSEPPGFRGAGDVRWIGTGEQYFLTAAAFGALEGEGGAQRACQLTGDPSGQIVAESTFPEMRLAPGQKTSYEMAAFLGPKLLDKLDAVKVGGADARLGDAIDYSLEFVARPLLWVLKQLQRVVVNWGVAIILITLFLKLLTYYPTVRSMRSMRAMAALKPKMDAIREKWKDDRNRQNQEVMNLYRDHKINPLGGCLPMLIQMPIYIAFYSMLSNSVELYRAGFVGPIVDMTAPYWPLAVLTGGIMFAQAKLSPQPAVDSQQQMMMMYMMPIMFTAFTIFLPSGLTLYIFTNTLLTMAQQWWFNRTHPMPAPVTKPARS